MEFFSLILVNECVDLQKKMISLDGSFGEGGGQILRTALTLSSITKKPFSIKNIRSNRLNPGLQPQHLAACFATRKICRGDLVGAEIGSTFLEFIPGEIVGGDYTFDIQTAGSSILVAQTVIPILLYASKKSALHIIGGTHLPKSPNYDYFENVFLSAIHLFGAKILAKCLRSGFYPKGGGSIEIEVTPSSLEGNTTWPKEKIKTAIIRLCSLPSHIADREKKILKERGVEKIKIYEESTFSPGNAITIFAGFKGASVLGERGKRAEKVAEEAIEEFVKEKNDVDQHLADQLLMYGALAKNTTQYTTTFLTQHLETNVHVLQQFIDKKIVIDKTNEFVTIAIS